MSVFRPIDGLAGIDCGCVKLYPVSPLRRSQMAKAKGNVVQVILECTEAPGTSRYHTKKNVRTSTGRMERKKYNSKLRKVTLHREKK
jgi:large subunit ribosomal protein L33